MTNAAIISGELTTMRHVPTRKVYQLIVEIPAEAAAAAFAALGTPGAVDQISVAVARLVDRREPAAPSLIEKPRTPFAELPLSQQAAMRCAEPEFQRFLHERQGAGGVLHLRGDISDEVAAHVRFLCGVDSRSDIGKGPNDRSTNDSGFKWRALDAEYYAWQRGRR